MILLRPATLADAELLRAWRNDPEMRKNSLHSSVVGKREHMCWLRASLKSQARRIYVAEASFPTGELVSVNVPGRAGPLVNPEFKFTPVGEGRLDFIGKAIEFDIEVDPEFRGRGYGREILETLVVKAREWKHGVPLVAHVKAFNTPSLRTFLRAGFAVKGKQSLELEMR